MPPSSQQTADPGVLAIFARVLQDTLGPDLAAPTYSRYLSFVLSHWLESDGQGAGIGQLPVVTCSAFGGGNDRALVVATAWQLSRLAAKLLDDVEDGESGLAASEAVSAATGLLFVAPATLARLEELGVPAPVVHAVCMELWQTGSRCSAGQHEDLVASTCTDNWWTPDTWLEVARAKSGEPLGWAAWAGAMAAEASPEAAVNCRAYGRHLGVLLQIADDVGGVWGTTERSDLATGQMTLPVCYALSVTGGAERARLQQLLARACRGYRDAEVQARDTLTALGAQHYTLVAARVQCESAKSALEGLNPANGVASSAKEQLIALLDKVSGLAMSGS